MKFRRGAVGFVAAVIAVAGVASAFSSGAVHQTADVYRFDTGADVGDAKLVRTDSGIHFTIKSSVEGELIDFLSNTALGVHFEPGDAITNWFLVFNNPENCVGPCDRGDVLDFIFDGDPNEVVVDVIFATGHVAGRQWRAGAPLAEGDLKDSLFGTGLMDAMKAEIHVLVRDHGPAANLTPGELAAAISEVQGGCGINPCGDPQFTVFPAP